MRGLRAIGQHSVARQPKEAIVALDNWLDSQPIDAPESAIIRLAGRLTLAPGGMTAEHISQAQAGPLDERAVYDVVMVSACFAFMNRLADGTGVTLMADRYALATELFGEEALRQHLRWGAGQTGP